MNFEWLKIAGAVAGIGGISLFVVFLVFREVIRVQKVFSRVTRDHTFKLLSKIITYTFIVGILGIVAYVILSLYSGNISHSEQITSPSTLNSNKIEEKTPESSPESSLDNSKATNTNQESLTPKNNNTSRIGLPRKQVNGSPSPDKPFIVDQKNSNGEAKD